MTVASKDAGLPDPLEHLDQFEIAPREPVDLPIITLVFETRADMMPRIQRITNWHRKFFRFHREVIVSNVNPNIPGTVFVNCGYLPPPEKMRMWYSDMCVHYLNNLCDGSHMLIWQWDGFIINPDLWTNDFYPWDYIGAPLGGAWIYFAHCMKGLWPNWKNPFDVPGQRHALVGNGGFSLRSKKFLESTDALDRTGLTCEAEDLYLCVERRGELEEKGIKFCPSDKAASFSVEGGDLSKSFGFHNRDVLLPAKVYLESKYLAKKTVPVSPLGLSAEHV